MATPNEFIITVMAKDQPGIIACISKTVASRGGSINELSQTVMRGYFTIILSAAFEGDETADGLLQALNEEGDDHGFSVSVRAFDNAPQYADMDADRSQFILTVQGADRPGIIAEVTSYLASQGINIEDFFARNDAGTFTLVLQIVVEDAWDADQLRLDLQSLGEETRLRVSLIHEDIFAATNELGAVKRLLQPSPLDI
ncbi:MAG: ACT domain-containing protein [Candidatus Poribacteria bacterium]|nr:ACT domain-containing protein [Candidatus Poribacteria bacterium]